MEKKRRNWGILLMIISIICSGCNVGPVADDKEKINKNTIEIEETEIPSKENSIEKICSQYETLELTEDDFRVTYHGVEVDRNIGADQIISVLGVPEGYEENNQGNISNGNGYRRWELSYPSYNEKEIRYLYLSEQEIDAAGNEIHGDGYIIGVYLIGVGTARDVKVGDTLENVLEQYGRPNSIVENSMGGIEIRYFYEKNTLEIVFDEENNVKSIFIDYNAEKADEEQGYQ